MITRRLAIGALVLALFASAAVNAQEMTTDAERSWRELRGSDDVKSKLMAERWYGVIKQQDWSDKSGKFKTSAKYLTHDPELAWVKLRVIQGAGAKRVVKDVQIPLEKLSPACQSRVRQIAALSEKVATAVEEEKTKDEEEKDGAAAGSMAEESVGPRGEVDGGLAAMDAEDVTAESRPRRGRRNRAAAARETPSAETPAQEVAPVTNNGPPLPALLPKPPAAQPSPSSPTEQPVATPDPALVEGAPTAAVPGEPPPAAASAEAWRTNYDAFRANITLPSGISDSVSFGPMTEVQRAHETVMREVGTGNIQVIQQSLAAIGEVTWEATVTGTPDEQGDWFDALGFAPPPEPIGIGLFLDTERDPGPWQNLKVGDRVRFIGRFVTFEDDYTIVLAIRFVAVEPAAGISPDATGRR